MHEVQHKKIYHHYIHHIRIYGPKKPTIQSLYHYNNNDIDDVDNNDHNEIADINDIITMLMMFMRIMVMRGCVIIIKVIMIKKAVMMITMDIIFEY